MKKTKVQEASNWKSPHPWTVKKTVLKGHDFYHLYDANGFYVDMMDKCNLKFIEQVVNKYTRESTK